MSAKTIKPATDADVDSIERFAIGDPESVTCQWHMELILRIRQEQKVKAQLQEFDRRKLWLQEEADAMVEEQLRAARDLIEADCKALQNAPNPFGETARQLGRRVGKLLGETSVHRRRMKFLGQVRRDGVVWVTGLGRRCVVKKIDRTRETCTVEVGKMRLEVPFEDISWLQPLDGRS